MKVFDKIKDLFADDDEEEVVDTVKKEVIQVEIPAPKNPIVEKEEEVIPTITKEEDASPFFDDTDFDEIKRSNPTLEEMYAREEKKEVYKGRKEEGKRHFEPTPIISPVYGVLDKNYKKDDIVNKEYYESIKETIKCSICFNIIKDPVQCDLCQHCFCSNCIKKVTFCPYRCLFNRFISSLICKNLLSELKIKCSCGTVLNYDSLQKHKDENKDCLNVSLKKNCLKLKNQNELLQKEITQLKQELNNRKQELDNCKQELNKYKQKNDSSFISDDKLFVSCSLHEHKIECLRRYYNEWFCDKCKKKFEKDIPSYHCTLCDFDLCFNCTFEIVNKDKNTTRFPNSEI